jgi:subtilisin family serine protease
LFYSISPIFGTEKLHSANPISKQKHALALNDNDYLKNTVILCIKKDFRNICSNEAIGNSSISEYLISIGAVNLKKKFPHLSPPESDYNERGEKLEDLTLIYEFQYKSELPLEKVLNFLTLSEVVEYAEPHYLPKAFYTPNDPQADSTNGAQYHLKNIRAYTGWDIDKGDTNVVIGITDTGYDFTHEDLIFSPMILTF